MYSFEPDEEQKMLVDWTRRFADDDLSSVRREAEESGELPEAVIQKGWELGVLQASIPEEFGGFGERSAVTGALAAEELAAGDLAGALAILAPANFALPILIAGSRTQQEAHLPAVIEGPWKPYTAAWIEPSFDFDPNALGTVAEKTGDAYVLTGQKTLVPFAAEAPALLIYASLEGQTQAFLVPPDVEGLEVSERQKLLGINAIPLYSLTLDGVEMRAEDRLGGPDGHDPAPLLAAAQVANAALAVGMSRAAFEYARDYAKDREVFGVKVAQKQSIAFMLAEMATEIEAMRLLAWEAAWQLDQEREEAYKNAYLANTGAIDMVMMVTDRTVQILGGHGYIREHPVELWMRNGRGFATLTGSAMV